jgi:formate/nitrite transporter
MNDLPPPQTVTLDPILPATMAARAEAQGVRRVAMDPLTVLVLSVLGGAFVSLGAVFATTASTGAAGILPFGVTRVLIGLTFSLGLILVIVAGAELFTGNTMIVMAWASGKVRLSGLLLNWLIAFVGNFIGAIATAGIVFASTQYTFGDGAVGLGALATANAKAALAPVPAFALGILCNALVCLTVWMAYSARTTVDRVVTVVPPIAAFATSGYEHCVANMYFLSVGLFIKDGAPPSFWSAIRKTPADFPALTWGNFLIGNLVPVTLGNIVGGSVMVGAVYWFVYLRKPAP